MLKTGVAAWRNIRIEVRSEMPQLKKVKMELDTHRFKEKYSKLKSIDGKR